MSIRKSLIHKIALNVSFLISFGISAFAQSSEQPVAKAGSIDILPSEFKERYELTPWPKGLNQPASKDPQLDFLYTLIAEKLLAQEAQLKGLDTSKSFQEAFQTIEKLYVRDALYKHVIESKINISQSDVNKAFEKKRYKLKLDYLKADSEAEILKIRDQLKKGKPFLSLDSSIVVSFGELDESLENALFMLKKGQYTQPMQAFGAWYILRLVEKTDQLALDPKDRDKLLSEARKIAHKRIADKLCNEFYKEFFRGKKVETDGEIFWSFSDKIISILKKRMNDPNIAEKERSHLVYDDFQKMENEFGPDTLKSAFIRLEGQPVSLGQFISEFAYNGFYCDKTDAKEVRARLDSRVKGYIESELLSREAYKLGLQNLPDVKRSLKMWKETYLAQVLRGSIMDSLRVSGIDNDSSAKKGATERPQILVNIVEILTSDLDTVENVLNELNNGRDIKELAVKYSRRESTRKTKGEFGYFPVTSNGEIGIISSKMKIGEIYGPLKTNEGYSIFKLIDKKEEPVSDRKSIDADSGKATYDLITQKYLKTLTEHTASLAKRYGVFIDNDQLSSLNALNLSMFAYRYMGFGGKIMAVPLTVPFTEWVKSWQNAEKALP